MVITCIAFTISFRVIFIEEIACTVHDVKSWSASKLSSRVELDKKII